MSDLSNLGAYFESQPAMAIAVSGGVDSMTLAIVAARANADTQIFHATSPAVPAEATNRVKQYAETEGWNLNLVDAGEMHDPEYLANPANRCYFCKTNLYDTVVSHTELRVASGTNTDDLGDYRPGLIAAEEHQVCHPYVELDISKAGLRQIAADLELDELKDLPAAPCLSSRVTTGISIDAQLLPLIDEVERAVWKKLKAIDTGNDIQGVRCRIREKAVAIQVESSDFEHFDSHYAEARQIAETIFRDNGYPQQVEQVLVEPYEKGSAFLIETLEVK